MKLARWLLLGACLPVLAQEPAAQDPVQVRRRLSEIQARLGTVDQQLNALKKPRKGVLVELQAIALQADRVRTEVEGARLRRDQTQQEVAAITVHKAEIQQDIFKLRGELRKQVRWMQALGPLGDLSLFSGTGSFNEYLVQGRYLAYLRNQERRRLDRIQHLQDDLAKQEAEMQAALKRLVTEERDATQLQANLDLQEARLSGFLEGLRLDESKQKSMQAELAEEALQLERMLAQLLAKPRSDAFESPAAFASLRGELPQPTPGALAQAFGEHLHPAFHTKTLQSGLLIAAEAGSPVQAVAEGKVVFADLYQSFGPMVILEHGGGWFTLYTHLQGLTVAKGQILKAGEALGAVGETMDGPRLGFEIRHLTQAQDPNPWLKPRYKAAEGAGRKGR